MHLRPGIVYRLRKKGIKNDCFFTYHDCIRDLSSTHSEYTIRSAIALQNESPTMHPSLRDSPTTLFKTKEIDFIYEVHEPILKEWFHE